MSCKNRRYANQTRIKGLLGFFLHASDVVHLWAPLSREGCGDTEGAPRRARRTLELGAAGPGRPCRALIWRWPPVPRNFPSCLPGRRARPRYPGGRRGEGGWSRGRRSLGPPLMRSAPPPLLSALVLALAAAAGAAGRNRRAAPTAASPAPHRRGEGGPGAAAGGGAAGQRAGAGQHLLGEGRGGGALGERGPAGGPCRAALRHPPRRAALGAGCPSAEQGGGAVAVRGHGLLAALRPSAAYVKLYRPERSSGFACAFGTRRLSPACTRVVLRC